MDGNGKSGISILVYPNPVNDKLNISGVSDRRTDLILKDASQKVLFRKIFKGNLQIDVSNLAGGLYFLEFNDGRETYHIEKVIVLD